jgi:hypothetical protein
MSSHSLDGPPLLRSVSAYVGDLDSPRPSATAKKRSYCREFKTALSERFSVHSLLSLILTRASNIINT